MRHWSNPLTRQVKVGWLGRDPAYWARRDRLPHGGRSR